MKYWDIARGELVDPDTPTLGEKFSIAGMDRDLNIQTSVANAKDGGLMRQGFAPENVDRVAGKVYRAEYGKKNIKTTVVAGTNKQIYLEHNLSSGSKLILCGFTM